MSYLRKRRQKKRAAQAREGRLCQREQEPTPTAAESQADVAQSPREHQMVRWMDPYRMGLTAKDAQFQVRMYSSKKYKSHRRVPERLARQFDQ